MKEATPESIEEIIEEEDENRTYSSIDDNNHIGEKLFPTSSYVDEEKAITLNEHKKSIYSPRDTEQNIEIINADSRRKINKTSSLDFIQKEKMQGGRLKKSRIVSENDKQRFKEEQEKYISERVQSKEHNKNIIFFQEENSKEGNYKISHFTNEDLNDIKSNLKNKQISMEKNNETSNLKENIFDIVKKELVMNNNSFTRKPKNIQYSLNELHPKKTQEESLDELSMEEAFENSMNPRPESASTTKRAFRPNTDEFSYDNYDDLDRVDTDLNKMRKKSTFENFKFEKEESDINLTLDEEIKDDESCKNNSKKFTNPHLSVLKQNIISLDQISNFCKKLDSSSGSNVNNIKVFNNINNSIIHLGKEPEIKIKPKIPPSIKIDNPLISSLKTHSPGSPLTFTLDHEQDQEEEEPEVEVIEESQVLNHYRSEDGQLTSGQSDEGVEQTIGSGWESQGSELPFVVKTIDSEDLSESKGMFTSGTDSQFLSSKNIVQKSSQVLSKQVKNPESQVKKISLKESLRRQVQADREVSSPAKIKTKLSKTSFNDSSRHNQEYTKDIPKKWINRGNSHMTKLKVFKMFKNTSKTSSSESPSKLRFNLKHQFGSTKGNKNIFAVSTKKKLTKNILNKNITGHRFNQKNKKWCTIKCRHQKQCSKNKEKRCTNFSSYSNSHEHKKKKDNSKKKKTNFLKSKKRLKDNNSYKQKKTILLSKFRSENEEKSSENSIQLSPSKIQSKANNFSDSLFSHNNNSNKKEINLQSFLTKERKDKMISSSKKKIKNWKSSLKRFQSVQNNTVPMPASKTFNDYGLRPEIKGNQDKVKEKEKLKRQINKRIFSICNSFKTKSKRCSHNTNLKKTFQVLSNQSKKELSRIRKKHTHSLKNSMLNEKQKQEEKYGKLSKVMKRKTEEKKKVYYSNSRYEKGKLNFDSFLKLKSSYLTKK
jgi:hypothetical protein